MRRSKKGVTLVELIVVLALLGVVISVAGGILSSFSQQYTRIALRQRAKDNITYLQQVFENEVRYAKTAQLRDDAGAAGRRGIFSDSANGGRVYAGSAGSDVFAEVKNAYEGIGYVVHFTHKGGSSVQMVVTAYPVVKAGGKTVPDVTAQPLYTGTRTVHLLSVSGLDVQDGDGDGMLHYLYYTAS